MQEEYKPVVDFENYEVSNIGSVRNVKTGKILNPIIDKHCYYHVNLYKNNKRTYKSIHRLVAEAFLCNTDNKECIDHQDNNKLNNNVNNLRFATKSENAQNAKISKTNTSGIKGVDKKGNKWRSQITSDGIRVKFRFI